MLAATNVPWELDEALRRRLEKRIYIPLPSAEGRKQLLRIAMKDTEVADDVDLDELAGASHNYSGADLTNVARDAAFQGMRQLKARAQREGKRGKELLEWVKQQSAAQTVAVCMEDFRAALAKVNKSVGDRDLERFEEWRAEFGAS